MKRRKVESSDDDDDEFYDRTTEADEKRKRKAVTEETAAKTYDELVNGHKLIKSVVNLLINILGVLAGRRAEFAGKYCRHRSENNQISRAG